MRTMLEIERAVEELPAKQGHELGEWLDAQRATLAPPGSVLALYDEEEGEGQRGLIDGL